MEVPAPTRQAIAGNATRYGRRTPTPGQRRASGRSPTRACTCGPIPEGRNASAPGTPAPRRPGWRTGRSRVAVPVTSVARRITPGARSTPTPQALYVPTRPTRRSSGRRRRRGCRSRCRRGTRSRSPAARRPAAPQPRRPGPSRTCRPEDGCGPAGRPAPRGQRAPRT